MKNILIAIFFTAVLYTFWFIGGYPKGFYYIDQGYKYVWNNFAAVIMHRPTTVGELQNKYEASSFKKIRVLLVPGHEPDYGGAEYRNLKERDMNVELAGYLAEFLKTNGHYDVIIARDGKEWNPILFDYFQKNWNDIIAFFNQSREENLYLISTGQMTKNAPIIYHNDAKPDVAMRLYGMNKWGNENSVDIAIHIHFNDYSRRNERAPGKYSGFTIYVPEHQYNNSSTTQAVAQAVLSRLSKYNAISDQPQEDTGLIQEQELIAIGANNSADAASMLVEYGYIYEPQFEKPEVRQKILKDMALETYLGLQDFFGSKNDIAYAYDTFILPYFWKNDFSQSNSDAEDALALQTALILEGFFPAEGRTKNECPRTGKFGPCTAESLSTFQRNYLIKGEAGVVGEKTRQVLNMKYSISPI